ncbi:MAG TPA: rhomboid family intramembrane serine protease [Gemmatimonadales bacterium]|nr:rhomboid family intramembrane serine protease [Gemmatimonadales bacterium]
MSPWVRVILIVNIAVFIWSSQNPEASRVLAFVPVLALRQPWTIVTYMFLHAGFGHILFNMLSLFFFGPQVEQRLGGRRFLMLYFIGGFTGALASAVITPRVGLVGASAATFAVFYAFARFWPRAQVLVWGVFPVEARVMIVIMTVISLLGGAGIMSGNIAHFAHLGGFLGGWLAMRGFGVRSALPRPVNLDAPKPGKPPAPDAVERWRQIPLDRLHPVNRDEAERVLTKLAAGGPASLTTDEREFLDRFSGI